MTPRRRTGGGSSSGSGDHTPAPDTHRPAGGTGGDGADIDPDNIDNMAGRLDNTETRVGDVGGRVEQVDVGPSSMGVIGSGFTGAARTHLRDAMAAIRRFRGQIGQAREGTRATARQYRDTEATNTQRMRDVESETDIPRTRTDTTATTPSSATTPSGTGNPPPATRDPGATTPSRAETPPPGSIGDRLGGGGDDGPPPDRTRPAGDDPNRRQPDRNPPPPQVGPQSLGRFDESRLTRDGETRRITHIDGVPVKEKLHQIAQERAAHYFEEKTGNHLDGTPTGRGKNPDLNGGQTGNCIGHVIDTRTGEIFESTNGKDGDVIPPSRVHDEIQRRVDDMEGEYSRYDHDGNPIPDTSHNFPWTDDPLRHAEVKGANEALHANPDSRLEDMVAESNFTRAPGLRDAPFCPNCSGILPDVPSNHGRREYDPETDRIVNRPH